MDGLGKGMIDGHPVRNGRVDFLLSKISGKGFRKIFRNIQRAGKTADITHRCGLKSNTERRHHLQKKSIEVV
jgi:hypothetical protein